VGRVEYFAAPLGAAAHSLGTTELMCVGSYEILDISASFRLSPLRFITVCLSSSKKMPGQCLYYATVVSFQILTILQFGPA
jgi:hypothetical protein